MAYISLYRKWRPRRFEEVVGQVHITKTLANEIKENHVSHAYLFCGPRGTGKTTTARILTKALNCAEGPTAKPCDSCESCLAITAGSFPDVIEIDAASRRKVHETQELLDTIPYSATVGRRKVYIIDEVHMLSTASFNTLLKTLEEPPEHVIFILATTEPHKVLATILSRCQRFDFRRIAVKDLVTHLNNVAETEEIEVEEEALALIAEHAQGSVRDALSSFEQLISFSSGKIGADEVTSLFGLTDIALLFEFSDILIDRDTAAGLVFAGRLTEDGRDLGRFLDDALSYFRNIFLLQHSQSAAELINVSGRNLETMKRQAERLQHVETAFFLDTLLESCNQARRSADPRLILDMTVVKLTKREVDASLQGVLYRLEKLEDGIGASAGKATNAASVDESPPDGAEVEESDFGRLKGLWPLIQEQVRGKRLPIHDLFLACRPKELIDGKLLLEFGRKEGFQKSIIEKPDNLDLIKRVIKNVAGLEATLVCVTAEVVDEESEDSSASGGKKTGKDEKPSAETKENEDISDDGVVSLVQDMFDAKIVEKTRLGEEGR